MQHRSSCDLCNARNRSPWKAVAVGVCHELFDVSVHPRSTDIPAVYKSKVSVKLCSCEFSLLEAHDVCRERFTSSLPPLWACHGALGCSAPACKESKIVAKSPTPRLVTARKPLMFQVTMRIRCWVWGSTSTVITKDALFLWDSLWRLQDQLKQDLTIVLRETLHGR